MLTILYGGTGTGKSYDMMEMIGKKASEGKNVIAIVPDQFTFEYEKMLYDHLGCALFNRGNAEVLSFSRLTADILRRSGDTGRDSADPSAKTALLYMSAKAVRERGDINYFVKQSKKPGFIGTLSAMLTELIHSGVTPERLSDIIEENKDASETILAKLRDILAVYTEYTLRLEKAGLRDSLFDMMTAAVKAGQTDYFKGKHIFMDEFKSFTGDQYDMISAMLSGGAELTVCMTIEPEASLKGVFLSAEETCGSLERIARESGEECVRIKYGENKRYRSDALLHISRALVYSPLPVYEEKTEDITLITAPDISSECSWICAKIAELTEEKGYKYSDIAVLSRTMNNDINELSQCFERYAIPYYSDKKPSAGKKPLMLMISSALELAASKKLSTEAVLRYAKTGLTAITDEETEALENFCYSWDIDGDTWEKKFPSDEKGYDYEQIKQRILAPIYSLRKKCVGRDGGEICEAVRDFIAGSDPEKKLLDISGADADDPVIRENRRICEELDRILTGLEKGFCEGEKVTVNEFREIFGIAAAGITLAVPPVYLDRVAAEQSDLARLPAVKAVFVMQACDGKFPFIPAESRTFTEDERELFLKSGAALSGSMKDRLSDERFNAYKAICSPSEKLFISFSKVDPEGKKSFASEYITSVLKAAPQCAVKDTEKEGLLFYCRTKEAAYSALILGRGNASEREAVKQCLSEDVLYKERFDYLKDLKNRNTYHTAPPPLMEKLMGGKNLRISPSRFEDHSRCPFIYFCKKALGINPPEKKGLTSMNWGNASHACMSGILSEYRSSDMSGFTGLTRSQLSEKVDRAAEKYVNENMGGDFARSADFPMYYRIMKENTLRALIRLQREYSEGKCRFYPEDLELTIGRKTDGEKSCPSIKTECEDGHTLELNGTVDRVDLCETDGKKYIRVIDYKTGKQDFKRDMLIYGAGWQMLFYLYSLTDPETGIYKDREPAGAIYIPIGYPQSENDRNSDNSKVQKTAFSSLKATGVILDDDTVIKAMDSSADGTVFIPGKRQIKDKVKDDRFTAEEFEEYRKKAEEKLKEMCMAVYSGEVPASPCEELGVDCEKCSYYHICAFFLKKNNDIDGSED